MYVVIGVLGFMIAPLFELCSLRGIPWLKRLIGVCSVGMIGYAIVMAALSSPKLVMPAWVVIPGWLILVLSVFLLTYSLFIDLPWRKTYVDSGPGGSLIRTGTYALVRHPGVLWFALMMVGTILVSGAELMLIAGAVWLVADVIYVVIQDRYLFVRMFPGYADYRRETPMLIPSRRSIEACLRSLK